MLNKVFLQGRLVADPELRHTQSGIAVATFRLAVDRDFKDKDTGEKKTDFINVVAWRHTGEFVSRFFTKGRMALVEGATDVVAANVYFGDSKRDGDDRERGPATTDAYSGSYQVGGNYQDQFADLTDDDDGELPF